jgi:hypothetical protein
MDSKEKQELQTLLDAGLDYQLTLEQVQRLDQLICTDSDARQYYLEEIALVTHLRRSDLKLSHTGIQGSDVRMHQSSSVFWTRGLQYFATVAIGFMIVAGIVWSTWQFGGTSHTTGSSTAGMPNEESIDNVIGTVVASDVSCANLGFESGKKMAAGRYQLEAGAISLVLRNGVTLDMEGPLDFDLKSPALLELRDGTARAHVPNARIEFVIKVPDMEIKDLGTEFGVSVRENKTSELHVFDGAVELTSNHRKPEIIQAGTAVSWNAGIRSEKERPRDSSFATREAIGYRNWKANFEELRHDPSAIICFDFRSNQTDPRIVNNEAIQGSVAQRISACEKFGPIEVSGRWISKESLLFEQGNDRIELEIPGRFETYTLATWVCFTRIAEPLQAIFTTHAADPGELHLQIGRDGSVRFGIQRVFGVSSLPGVVTVGKWHNIAVVVDHKNGFAVCYVDGKPLLQERFETDIPFVFGKSQIGAWVTVNPKNETEYDRFFRGRIDEFVLLNRILSEEEIQRNYQQGKVDFQPVQW